MATKEKIEEFLKSLRCRRNEWYLSTRPKNLLTLSELGIIDQEVFDIIDKNLSWKDYCGGPESDNHVPPIPGDIWKFGLTIQDHECYLKLQDKPDRTIMWISIHDAEYPLTFPYR